MTGYKIFYTQEDKPKDQDTNWQGWTTYDNIVYTDRKYAKDVMEDAQEQFPNYNFEIYEQHIV